MQNKNVVLYVLRIAVVLLLICGIMAGLLAVVNDFTKDKIAANELAKEQNAIAEIFGEGITLSAIEKEPAAPVEKMQRVEKDGAELGIAVNVTGSGFGGDIDMIVGVTSDGIVLGVKILSMAETPGVGSKTADAGFLAQYMNATAPFAVKENIDAVSGATISSKAVTAAVNAAVEAAREA